MSINFIVHAYIVDLNELVGRKFQPNFTVECNFDNHIIFYNFEID